MARMVRIWNWGEESESRQLASLLDGGFYGMAECNSAIQQSATLRYGLNAKKAEIWVILAYFDLF